MDGHLKSEDSATKKSVEESLQRGKSKSAKGIGKASTSGENATKKSRLSKTADKSTATVLRKRKNGSIAKTSSTAPEADLPSSAVSLSEPAAQIRSAAFSAHLNRIKTAKTRADELLSEDAPSLDAHSASVALLWEIVFDRLCAGVDMSASELNAIAGVIQKMASPRAKSETSKTEGEGGISAQTLQDIERQLKLL